MPAETPKAIVVTVNAEVNKLLAMLAVQAAIHAQCGEPQVMTSGQL